MRFDKLTAKFQQALAEAQSLALVDVSLLDHFIVTATEACSMREQGYMEG